MDKKEERKRHEERNISLEIKATVAWNKFRDTTKIFLMWFMWNWENFFSWF
jgi:hypothetical protein